MNQVRPSSILLVVSGVMIAVSSFLAWQAVEAASGTVTSSAWDYGMLGLFQLIVGVIVALIGALALIGRSDALSNMNLLGLSPYQLAIALGLAVALWGFALNFEDGARIGTFFTWVSGVVAIAGGALGQLKLDG